MGDIEHLVKTWFLASTTIQTVLTEIAFGSGLVAEIIVPRGYEATLIRGQGFFAIAVGQNADESGDLMLLPLMFRDSAQNISGNQPISDLKPLFILHVAQELAGVAASLSQKPVTSLDTEFTGPHARKRAQPMPAEFTQSVSIDFSGANAWTLVGIAKTTTFLSDIGITIEYDLKWIRGGRPVRKTLTHVDSVLMQQPMMAGY